LNPESQARRKKTEFWEHENNRAVRNGKCKLVAIHGPVRDLYDREVDYAELQNLAGKHPDVAARLAQEWDAWARRCAVK
jgi:arylsulfatase